MTASARSSANGGLAHAERRDIYLLTARLFAAEIDRELYRRLVSKEMDALADQAGIEFVELELRKIPEEQAIERLAVEFCRLFVGPAPERAPFASVQRGEIIIGGRARKRLDEFMERHGLTLNAELPIASVDHIAVALSLLACLYDEAADSESTDALRIAREFLKDHLLPWAPDYLEALSVSAKCAPYGALGRLTAALLTEERELHGL